MSLDALDVVNFRLVRGTVFGIELRYTSNGSTAIDLTGVEVTWAIKWPEYYSPTVEPVEAGGLLRTSSLFTTDGVITFTLNSDETALFPVSCVAQKGPPVAYQVLAGNDLVLSGFLEIERNLALELA